MKYAFLKAVIFLLILFLIGCVGKPQLSNLEVIGASYYLPDVIKDDKALGFKIDLKLNKAPLFIRIIELKENGVELPLCSNEIKEAGFVSFNSCLGDPMYNLFIRNPREDHKLKVCFGYSGKIANHICTEPFILEKISEE